MTDSNPARRRALAALATLALGLAASPVPAQTGDYIVAVVNQELVTAAEVQQRLNRVRAEAQQTRSQLPPATALRKQVVDVLIDERVLVTNARESGMRIDESELDRAVANVAAQNQLTPSQLRDRLRQEGLEYAKFRSNIRDQMLVERMREREVASRIRVTDAEIDALIEERRNSGANSQFNIAQILIVVPETASQAVVAERRGVAQAALRRVRGGEEFAAVARELSQDGYRASGGEIGMRPTDRLPDVFVKAVRPLKSGEISPDLLRSAAGFHVLKLVDRKDDAFSVQQVRARHILLRPSSALSSEAAARRLTQFRRDILGGGKSFEQLARENSEDSSAAQGGDLGWTSAGAYVPEFEEALSALDVGGISEPLVTRFGVHLIQVVDRRQVILDTKQQREQARNMLREQKFEDAYAEWLRDLRGRAYIELRDPPQ